MLFKSSMLNQIESNGSDARGDTIRLPESSTTTVSDYNSMNFLFRQRSTSTSSVRLPYNVSRIIWPSSVGTQSSLKSSVQVKEKHYHTESIKCEFVRRKPQGSMTVLIFENVEDLNQDTPQNGKAPGRAFLSQGQAIKVVSLHSRRSPQFAIE